MYEASSESELDPKAQLYNPEISEKDTLEKLKTIIKHVAKSSPFYQKKFKDSNIDVEKIESLEDLKFLPFTYKEELRDAYPLGLKAVSENEVVRIHSSSGTTGKPVIIPYTRKDVDIWALMMMRCYMLAGLNSQDRIQITPGYGLWTAGIGFQLGAERLGAMAIPTGPGNTEKQLEMLIDLKSTALASTSSYALLLAEEIQNRNLKDKIHLRVGVIGSERWSDKMRSRIETELGIETFDIYGLTEIYGPGIALDCSYHEGMHYWSDHLLFEIIDPITEEQLPEGTLGELVITTLTKEGAPLIRYRTRDLTRIIPGLCKCGCPFPRIDRILGRSDDRIKFKAVNIYPGQIEDVIHKVPGVSSEYQILLKRNEGRDSMIFKVEIEEAEDPVKKAKAEKALLKAFKDSIGVTVNVVGVKIGELPRSMKKTKRVIDEREL
jgi:phenylacetate-CoA ligase